MENIVGIIPAKAQSARRWPRPWGTTYLSLLLGVALVGLAAPRLVGETGIAVSKPALRSIEHQEKGAAERLRITKRIIDLATDVGGGATAWQFAGRIRSAEAQSAEPAVAERLRDEAGVDFARALSAEPLDHITWYRYAQSLFENHRYLEAARAWRMSVETGIFDYQVIYPRVEAGIALWPYMDLQARAAFGRQLIALWRWEPGGLAWTLYRFHAAPIGLRALEPWPEAQEDMRDTLSRLVSRSLGIHE